MNNLMLTEEEQLLKSTAQEFSDHELAPRAAYFDEHAEFPVENLRKMSELGLFGLTVDENYGGSGGSMKHLAIAVEEIARGCGATSVIYIAHLSLCTQFIAMYGTEQQKERFLPPLVRADSIGAFGLTEPEVGSDAAAIRTSITSSGDGHYLINGSKQFTTNAVEADIFVVLVTHDRQLRSRGVDALIVEKDTPGLTINPQHGKMGMRASSTAELIFKDCPVDKVNRLGPEGEGFREAMNVLNASRIPIAAQCVGLARAAYETSVQYAKQRQAFGNPLTDFQSVQWKIADMATEIDAARLLVHRAASLKDEGKPYAVEASMAKLFASRAAVECADRAVQIHGGTGYFAPSIAERLYRDAKVTEIYEGTSEIQRLIIARNILELR